MSPTEQVPSDAMSDRRESPRVPMRFLVRDPELGGSYEECAGDLAVGGAYFRARYPPVGKRYEVRFHLLWAGRDIRMKGEVLSLNHDGTGVGLHVRFTGGDVADELAIARFIEEAGRTPR
jgi:hypothetical protein